MATLLKAIFCWLSFLGIAITITTAASVNGKFELLFRDTRLAVGILEATVGVFDRKACAVRCFLNVECLALNFADQEAACEILGLSVTGKEDNLTAALGYTHYELTFDPDPCRPNPCLYGGMCLRTRLSTAAANFSCSCPYPMGGPTCADFACKVPCYQRQQQMIFLYVNKTLRWSAAKALCESESLTMIMIKNNVTHQFVRASLKHYHRNEPTKEIAYWVGMNRTSAIAAWKYIDGTALGTFKPWAPNRPSTELCLDIANTQAFNFFDWDDDPCNPSPTELWQYYTVCTKNYPFLS